MVNERNRDAAAGLEPAYEPPRALRVGGLHAGTGGTPAGCRGAGSGAEGDCATGNSATVMCFDNGSSADKCDGEGSGAATGPIPLCEFQGSDHAVP